MKSATDQLAWFRLKRSGLVTPFSDPVAAAETLVGLQAQVLRSAGLSLSARLAEPFTKSDLEGCLYRDRSLVKLWGQRRTLHLYAPRDWPFIFSVFENRTTWTTMVTRKVGGDLEALAAGAQALAARLEEVDALSRKLALAERPDLAPFLDLGIGLFMDVVQMGAACHVEPIAGESFFSHRRRWLPDLKWDPPSRDSAGASLTRRYLASYGPATAHDVAFWLGEKVTDVRRWLEQLGPEVCAAPLGSAELLILARDVPLLAEPPPPRSSWPVRLLHRYDVLLLSHKDKSWLIDAEHYTRVWKKAGVVDAVLLVGGRIVGVWKYALKTRSVRIVVTPFGTLSGGVKKKVEREAHRVAAHLELTLAGVDYE